MTPLSRYFSCLAVVATLTACGPAQAPQTADVYVVATTSIVGDLVTAVAGDDLQVRVLMGPGVDPHLYKPTAGDARVLADAAAFFYNGLHLEGKMTEWLQRLREQGKASYALAEVIPEERLLGDDPLHADPHVWGDPRLWSHTVQVVVAGLSKVVPEKADLFQARGMEVRERLLRLHDEIGQRLMAIPEERRVLITSHDAFAYWGRAFQFEVLAIQGLSTVSEASMADVSKTIDLIRRRGLRTLFVESSVSPALIQRISRETGVEVAGELFSDALGGAQETREVNGRQMGVGTYEGMMRYNAEQVALAAAAPKK